MDYWNDRPPSETNIRLFGYQQGWRRYDDTIDIDGRVTFSGASRDIELALSTALNASNLLLLTGAGSSFSAENKNKGPSAPSMSDLWDAVENSVSSNTLKNIIDLIPNAVDIDQNIEKLLTLSKLYVSLFNDSNSKIVTKFIEDAEIAILNRVDFVDNNTNLDSHRTLVRKIARRGVRKPRTKIFTTNYDLCFEYAAQQQQFVVIDGFSRSIPQVYDRAHFEYDIVRRGGPDDGPNYIENVVQLYKLHGSLDWRRSSSAIVRSKGKSAGDPVLIYPRDTKYQEAFETPYLDMMGAFQTALREPDTVLIVSGFGFKDDHISKPIMAAVEANMSLSVVLCDVAFLESKMLETDGEILPIDSENPLPNEYLRRFVTLAEGGDKRITILNGRFEDLALAIPDLVAQTDRERHFERMNSLREM